MVELNFTNDDQTRHYIKGATITGSEVFVAKNGREIVHVQVTQMTNQAADMADAVDFSWTYDPTDKSRITVHAWTENAGTDRIAATSAVTVSVCAWTI